MEVKINKKTKKEDIPSSKLVVQHNRLVEARYRISLQEKRIILWLISQIKPTNDDFTHHKIAIKDFCSIVGVSPHGMYYELQKITKKLISRVITIKDISKNRTLQTAWVNVASYWHNEGIVELKIASELKPYLLELQKEFTVISVTDAMALSSIYAIRVYELLKQYESIGERKLFLEDLRLQCGISEQKYKRFNDFKKDVLERSKKELNAKTDLLIDYEEIKTSRKITSIKFTIKRNPAYDLTEFEKIQQVKAVAIQKEYRSELVLIESLVEYGFSNNISKKLIKSHGEEVVRNAMKAVDLQMERRKVKNPKAMLQTAIRERWNPEVFKSKKKAG